METSVYMIKPEGMGYREQIRTLLLQELEIRSLKTLVLPYWVIDEFYPDLSIDLLRATLEAFKNPIEIGLVCGKDAVSRLLALAGTKTAPAECSPESIRYCFGKKEPIMVGSSLYYLNAIHRPKDLAEAEAHIRIHEQL